MEMYDEMDLKPSAAVVAGRCGTWRLALAKLGVRQRSERQYTERDCLSAIHNLTDDLGHEPTTDEFTNSDYSPSLKVVYSYFDSWDDAKEAAGVVGYGHQHPEEEADEFFEMLEDAEPK